MSNAVVYSVPRFAELKEAGTQGFVLQVAPGQGVRVGVLELREGVPMSRDYECYSLLLVLPLGVIPVQGVFNLFGPGRDQPWQLMMTPLMPEPDGRQVLEAVVQYKRQVADNTTI
ncbi:hypothetical protein [Pseudomonas sp. Leaf127]|uniref:hypothetical protein n=1 Tax=Pseudomonas sp. Leaf127 TaxID=1736267 RepID=UPI000AC8FBEC|nr:hypothetical protein [Pseudomonas sp. Leaf127]